jgi:hypothetical protein
MMINSKILGCPIFPGKGNLEPRKIAVSSQVRKVIFHTENCGFKSVAKLISKENKLFGRENHVAKNSVKSHIAIYTPIPLTKTIQFGAAMNKFCILHQAFSGPGVVLWTPPLKNSPPQWLMRDRGFGNKHKREGCLLPSHRCRMHAECTQVV